MPKTQPKPKMRHAVIDARTEPDNFALDFSPLTMKPAVPSLANISGNPTNFVTAFNNFSPSIGVGSFKFSITENSPVSEWSVDISACLINIFFDDSKETPCPVWKI
jgi:hypothetical protein